jgi:hypothetical protein
VVVLAEEDTVGDVRSAAVPFPLVDVVSFTPGRGPVAAGPDAASVPNSEAFALLRGEEALLAADVDALAVVVEDDRDGT